MNENIFWLKKRQSKCYCTHAEFVIITTATKHTHEYVPYIHNQTNSRHMCQVYIDEQGMNPLKNVCGQIILAKIKNCERDKKAVAFAFAIVIQLYRVY